MKTFLKTLLIVACFSVTIMIQSCDSILDSNQTIGSQFKKFDVDLFEKNIQVGLSTHWVGYAYVINKDGNLVRSGAYGKWTRGTDGNTNADIHTGLYAASISKTITAVAVLKAMDDHGSGAATMLNHPITAYLPPLWNVDPQMENVRIRHLLQHRSGIAASVGPEYSSIKSAIGQPPGANGYTYSNANYGLLRIVLYKLVTGELPTGNDEEIDAKTLWVFEDYVRENLLKPIGVDASLRPSSVRYYRWGDQPITAGWNIGPRTERLGSGAWYISPENMAKFIAYLNHSTELLSKATRDLMYSQFLGWSDGADPTTVPAGDHGIYYTKSGSFCNAGTDNACTGQGVRTMIMSFPNGVELVFMANNRGNNMSLTNMARTAFDSAWK